MAEDNMDTSAVLETLDAARADTGKLEGKDKLAADMALFEKVTGDSFKPEPKEKKPKAEPKPKKQEKAVEPEEPDLEDDEEEIEDEEPEEKPVDPRVAEARAKLASVYPKGAVEASSDEEALAWWNRHNEADYDRSSAKEQALDLQKRLAALEKPKEPEAPKAPLIDTEGISKSLEDHFGEETGKAMASILGGLLEPVLGEVRAMKETQAQEQEQRAQAVRSSNYQRLTEIIPQLKSKAARAALDATANMLLEEPKANYSTADELYNAAAEAIYGEGSLEPKEDIRVKQKKRVRSAQFTTESRKGGSEALTPEERDLKAFERTEQKRKAGEYHS